MGKYMQTPIYASWHGLLSEHSLNIHIGWLVLLAF
jgi:hypothetical protein